MNAKQPLLSLCIPTYNRAKILEDVLNNYVSNKEFDDEVEIVISDNASTDDTQSICEKFTSKYPNIRYRRNDTNLIDKNFPLVLDAGKGKYLKLINDTCYYDEEGLKYVKDKIKEHIKDKPQIYFNQGILTKRKNEEIITCNSLDEYVLVVAASVTNNRYFGAWIEDWREIKDKTKYWQYKLQQQDWNYQLVERKGGCIIYNKKILCFSKVPIGLRGGYNWFKIHLDCYSKIMQPYIDKGAISKHACKMDKRNLLNIFRPHFCNVYFPHKDKNWGFDTEGTTSLVWKYYKSDLLYAIFFFFIRLPFFYTKIHTKSAIKKVLRKLGLWHKN